MVAVASQSVSNQPAWHQAFAAMLPAILRMARFALRRFSPDAREEALQDVVANCCVAFARLVARGKADCAFPSVLVRYAVSQYQSGRRVGSSLNVGDVMSRHAQFHQRFCVEHLDRFDRITNEWREALIEDRKTCVADQAAFRIDFPAWLRRMSARDRLIAEALALSYTTQEVALRFGLSEGRISQMRRELHRSWRGFHGEQEGGQMLAVACG